MVCGGGGIGGRSERNACTRARPPFCVMEILVRNQSNALPISLSFSSKLSLAFALGAGRTGDPAQVPSRCQPFKRCAFYFVSGACS